MATNVPPKELIAEAYHIRADNLSGAPNWTETERFDIVAKAPPATSPDDLRQMMVALLRERFGLATHTEQKVIPAYALVKAKNGPSLKQSEPARDVDGGCAPARASTRRDRGISCQHMSMADLADALPDMAGGYIDTPVVDRTGVEGFYDFELSWTPAARLNSSGTQPTVGSGLSVFKALEDQAGLKLESRKLPLPVVVIDHVDRTPTGN